MSTAAFQRMDAANRPYNGHWSQHHSFDAAAITKALSALVGDPRRADDISNTFVMPELIHISKIANEQVFPEITYDKAFALAMDPPPWFSRSYSYNDATFTGSPEDDSGADWSDPGQRVTLNRKPNLSPILPKTTQYGWNIAEIAQAASVGLSLPAMSAIQARRVVETEFDIRAWLGRPNLGIPGLLTATGIGTDNASKQWSDPATTTAEIYADIQAVMYQGIVNASLGAWLPTHLAIPQTCITAFTRPMVLGGVGLMVTLGEYVKSNLQLEILPTVRLNHATPDMGKTGAAVMFRKDALTQRHILARGYYENAAQMVGRDLIVFADGVSGGLVVPQPTSVFALGNVAATL